MPGDEEQPESPTTINEAQVRLIDRAFEAAGIAVSRHSGRVPEEPTEPALLSEAGVGEVDFLHEAGTILVRDEDIPRVQEVIGEAAVVDSLIVGVSVLSLERSRFPSTVQALNEIDTQLGIGVATPNHVVSITPASTCPATEPEEVPGDAEPDPGVCPDHQDGSGVFIHVPDTGLLQGAVATHPWLAGVEPGDKEDPFPQPPPANPMPAYTGHGTFIAGVARCMAPASEMMVENVFSLGGAHLESEIIRGLYGALDRSPDVICLSAGTRTRYGLPPLAFEVFLRRLREHKGVVLVAAAGNDGDRGPFWPAAFPGVVSVGALAANWRSRASFSNYGGWVDVFAPGERLVNAFASGIYECKEPPHAGEHRTFHGMARWSGTSFATPLVAGLIAARMSRTGENGRQAAEALLAKARSQALRGVGPVLLPGLDA
jgi:subtilisin family serine protease